MSNFNTIKFVVFIALSSAAPYFLSCDDPNLPSNVPTKISVAPSVSSARKKDVAFDYIDGLYMLDILSNPILDKKVYLLGEIHSKMLGCPPHLKKVIKASKFVIEDIPRASDNKFIDIFLEEFPWFGDIAAAKAIPGSKALANVKTTTESYLVDTIEQLKPCITSPHKCPNANMRAHWTDLRLYIYPMMFSYDSLKAYLSYLADKYLPSFLTKGQRVLLPPEAENILNAQTLFNYIKNNIILSGKIFKQWSNVDKSYLELFLEHLKNNIEEEYREWMQKVVITLIKREKDGTLTIEANHIIDYTNALRIIFSPVVEAYALGRFLRTFKTKNKNQPEEIKNAVMYFGGAHTLNMKNYLLKIGFISEKSFSNTYEKYDLCLDVKGLTEPYF